MEYWTVGADNPHYLSFCNTPILQYSISPRLMVAGTCIIKSTDNFRPESRDKNYRHCSDPLASSDGTETENTQNFATELNHLDPGPLSCAGTLI